MRSCRPAPLRPVSPCTPPTLLPSPAPRAAGTHTLRLACTLWVYNLTGLPISLRQTVDDPLVLRDRELKEEEDVVR